MEMTPTGSRVPVEGRRIEMFAFIGSLVVVLAGLAGGTYLLVTGVKAVKAGETESEEETSNGEPPGEPNEEEEGS